jgi:hypothetical protein
MKVGQNFEEVCEALEVAEGNIKAAQQPLVLREASFSRSRLHEAQIKESGIVFLWSSKSSLRYHTYKMAASTEIILFWSPMEWEVQTNSAFEPYLISSSLTTQKKMQRTYSSTRHRYVFAWTFRVLLNRR